MMEVAGKYMEAPAKTSFQFSLPISNFGYSSLLFERGVRKPSPTERPAPFYQDPTQRIAASFRLPRFPSGNIGGTSRGL